MSDDKTEISDVTKGGGKTRGFTEAEDLARIAGSGALKLLKDRFVLETVLGRGGMGEVYRARDLRRVEAEDSNPYVAVKVLAGDFRRHPQAFVTLQQEAVKSQKLAHPNVVTVYDFDREDDTVFMTMELLKGDPLGQLLKHEGKFSKESATRYFRELCAGLIYAHKRGIVHSDFKPENIFVTTSGVVKILDFGIARAISGSAMSASYDAGSLGALTPAYATAEMVRGEPPDFSDDIYALACVTYLMLTGEHPYGGKSALDAATAKLVPKKPAALDKREWDVLRSALSVEKSKRPESVEAFQAALAPAKPASGRRFLLPAVGLVVLGAVVFGYLQTQDRVVELPVEANERLQAARDCFINEDYDCTIENALVAKNLNADDAEADRLLTAARNANAARDAEQKQQDIDARLQAAKDCYITEDFECAIENALVVKSLAPDNTETDRLLEVARRSLDERNAATELQTLLSEAQQCLTTDDLECAEVALATVTRRFPDSPQGAQLVRELEQAQQAAAEVLAKQISERNAAQARAANERIASAFVEEADDCFKRKDYSCSIAKTESALAILPDYEPALVLAEKAKTAQAKAKMNISIE